MCNECLGKYPDCEWCDNGVVRKCDQCGVAHNEECPDA